MGLKPVRLNLPDFEPVIKERWPEARLEWRWLRQGVEQVRVVCPYRFAPGNRVLGKWKRTPIEAWYAAAREQRIPEAWRR